MQTQLPLQSIGPVIHGYHENPFEVLGPHEIEQRWPPGPGRAGLLARGPAGLGRRPAHRATRADAADPPGRLVRSDRRGTRHETASGENETLRSPRLANPRRSPYQLRVTYKSGETTPCTIRMPSRRCSPTTTCTCWRRHALEELRAARVASADGRRRERRELRRLGAECRERRGRRRLQHVGSPQPRDAEAHPQRRLGIVHSRRRSRARTTSSP